MKIFHNIVILKSILLIIYTSYKITNSHISFIKQQLKQNKTITMDELLVKLKTKYPDLTLSRVHLLLQHTCLYSNVQLGFSVLKLVHCNS